MGGYVAVNEKDVGRRKGEGKKRRMSLRHVGWSVEQWRRSALETTSTSNCFASGPGLRNGSARSMANDDLETNERAPTLYFGYGSNMWVDQMDRRCPKNKYIGTAVLHDW